MFFWLALILTFVHLWFCEYLSGKSSHTNSSETENNSPFPWGEGRDEGEPSASVNRVVIANQVLLIDLVVCLLLFIGHFRLRHSRRNAYVERNCVIQTWE